MVDRPTATELKNDILLARMVELSIEDDKYLLLRSVSINTNQPKLRTDHGGNLIPIYTFGKPDNTLRFTLTASKDEVDRVYDLGRHNSTTNVPENQTWTLRLTSADGSHREVEIDGVLDGVTLDAAPENSPGLVSIVGTVTITDGTFPEATTAT